MITQTEVERVSPTRIAVQCRKCHERVNLEFGDMTYSEALEAMRKLDTIPRECPGYHVELGGWWWWWRMDEALAMQYPNEHKPEPAPNWSTVPV
jgi:hypothetical protein